MMKRPKLEYAENCTLIHTYARKLEEYCDQLEAIVSKGDCVSHYEKKIEVLEKALDKACEELEELDKCNSYEINKQIMSRTQTVVRMYT